MPLTPLTFRELHKAADGKLLTKDTLQQTSLLGGDSVLDKAKETSEVPTEEIQVESPPEILLIVVSEVRFVELCPLCIVQLSPQREEQQVELKSHTQETPIFKVEVCEERLPVANVHHILHNGQVFILHTSHPATSFLLCFPLVLPLPAIVEVLKSSNILLLEPCVWMQVGNTNGKFLLYAPLS